MTSFAFSDQGYTAGQGWRPLKLTDQMQRGWDVYDLQSRLLALGFMLTLDGYFGTQTQSNVKKFQSSASLWVDGIAGSATQTTLGVRVASASELSERVHGQMEKESSLLCGIYTAPYANGSRDRGIVQENSQYYASDAAAFDVRQAVPALVSEIKAEHLKYAGWGVEDSRAWAAAQGSWNSPKYADAYARGQSVPDSFLEYVAAVTAYVK